MEHVTFMPPGSLEEGKGVRGLQNQSQTKGLPEKRCFQPAHHLAARLLPVTRREVWENAPTAAMNNTGVLAKSTSPAVSGGAAGLPGLPAAEPVWKTRDKQGAVRVGCSWRDPHGMCLSESP